jgi:L-ribulose-5-phosphate 3-epimerase
MIAHQKLNRRSFVAVGASCALAPTLLRAEETPSPWLRKTLKIGMVRSGETLAEKFAIAKEAGFAGIELNVPGFNIDEANAASVSTGLIIDGTVGSYHWKIRHTDPDVKVREEALANLKQGLRDTAAVGADTMLLVPGHGQDGSAAEVYERAMAAIRSALPVAEETGVSILIENVWNHFLYRHDGPDNQTADALAKFVDAFDSPLVGVQFDIGNHWKYGDPAEWIRTLGDRIKKLDIKGFSRETGNFTKITEGDIRWPEVEAALHDIGFTGWLAAEVGGGDLDRLREVAENMERALNCSKSVSRAG